MTTRPRNDLDAALDAVRALGEPARRILRAYISLRCGTGARRPPRRAATMTMAAIDSAISDAPIAPMSMPAAPICEVMPSSAARAWDFPMCRWRTMFSTSTMASSTRMPTTSDSAKVRCSALLSHTTRTPLARRCTRGVNDDPRARRPSRRRRRPAAQRQPPLQPLRPRRVRR